MSERKDLVRRRGACPARPHVSERLKTDEQGVPVRFTVGHPQPQSHEPMGRVLGNGPVKVMPPGFDPRFIVGHVADPIYDGVVYACKHCHLLFIELAEEKKS